jgi:hypothetical protein
MSEVNPLLAKIKLPGKIFQLPSKGLFYKNGELEPHITNGEIHVRPMSALAEIHLKNPDQLFSGQAVETVFKECVSGVVKPHELLSKDVDAILIFLRLVTYGADYEFAATHTCKDAKSHSYTANVEEMIGDMKMIDPTMVDELFTVTLQNDQVVKLMPSRYHHVVELLKENVGREQIDVESIKKNLIMMLASVVVQVDDVTDPAMIKEWLMQIPTTWVTRISDRVESVNEWGPTLRWKGHCKDCEAALTVELPINPVTFFTE